MAEPKTNRICDHCGVSRCARRAKYCSYECKNAVQRQPLADRLAKYITQSGPDECWLWTGRVVRNYGQLKINGKGIRSHRLAWELANGPIPDGQWVLHHCDRPLCCNPKHLFLGTVLENNRDAAQKRRHTHGSRHHQAKLTAEQVHQIRNSVGTPKEIGKRFGISGSHVGNLRYHRSWKHLT